MKAVQQVKTLYCSLRNRIKSQRHADIHLPPLVLSLQSTWHLQLLFDVDWRSPLDSRDLDALVIDMPPGTGDVQLSLGQLVVVDGKFVGTYGVPR